MSETIRTDGSGVMDAESRVFINSWPKQPPVQGWQCPICGRIMSPTTPFCPCDGHGYRTTSTTGTTGDADHLKCRPTITSESIKDNVITGGEDNGEITATNTLEYYIKNVFPNLPFPKESEE